MIKCVKWSFGVYCIVVKLKIIWVRISVVYITGVGMCNVWKGRGREYFDVRKGLDKVV